MPKPIPGDPLTGSLPRTQLIVPQDILGPVRTTKKKKDGWPNIADPLGITRKQVLPGRIAAVRTRRGVRTWQVRTVNISRELHNKGRRFFVGMDRNGMCHSAWIEDVISVETMQRALGPGKP